MKEFESSYHLNLLLKRNDTEMHPKERDYEESLMAEFLYLLSIVTVEVLEFNV